MTPTRRRALAVLLAVVLLGLLAETFLRVTGTIESPVPEFVFGTFVTIAVVGTLVLALTSSRRSLARETDLVQDDPMLMQVPPVGRDAVDQDEAADRVGRDLEAGGQD